MTAILVLEFQDIGSDLNEERVQLRLIPLIEGLIDKPDKEI